jgi:hypothetical protein
MKNPNKPVMLIELLIPTDSPEETFASIGLPNAAVLTVHSEDGDDTYFAMFTVPHGKQLLDCVALVIDGEVVAFTHGTDCTATELVQTDLKRGTNSLWAGCSRREAGGAFRAVAIPDSAL